MSETPSFFYQQTFANGLTLEVTDLSRRYYGDYHKVILEVVCRVALTPDLFARQDKPRQALEQARRVLGEEARSVNRLERLGVAGNTLDHVKSALWDSFRRSSLPYLQRPDYPVQMVTRLFERPQKTRPHLRSLQR